MRKRWLAIALTMTILATGLIGTGIATADETAGSPFGGLASKVATILGLDEATVQDAIDQAQTELHDETMQSKLDALVESGAITQEQADARGEWYGAMPDVMPGFGGHEFGFGGNGFKPGERGMGPGGRGHGRGGFGGFGGFHNCPPAQAEEATPSAEGTSF